MAAVTTEPVWKKAWGGRGKLLAAACATALIAWWLLRDTSSPVTPAARLAEGRSLFAAYCLHCHREIRLEARVAGWDEARAYETVGKLSKVNRAMPHFEFADDDRRALAAYLVAVGRGEERPPR